MSGLTAAAKRAQTIRTLAQVPQLNRKINPKRVAIDCSYRDAHRADHHPHPRTKRMLCYRCHPPLAELVAIDQPHPQESK